MRRLLKALCVVFLVQFLESTGENIEFSAQDGGLFPTALFKGRAYNTVDR